MNEKVDDAMRAAAAAPEDVAAQIEAAYTCDRYGSEEDAIGFYDRAWALGVPGDVRLHFCVGYGSTLRNVGRLAESVEVLSAEIERRPDYAPYHAFLGLTLHDLGQHAEAAASLLTATLVGGAAVDKYERALTHYRDALRGDAS